MTQDIKRKIENRLSGLSIRRVDHPTVGDAGVLMPILQRSGESVFLLTKRTDSVSTHKGQISFPGGVHEAGDGSLLRTALRETEEELGIPTENVEVLGCFHEYLSVTELRVVPYVGFLKGLPEIKLNPSEVERVLEVPLDFFRQSRPRREERRKFGRVFPVFFYDFGDEVIWGLTAGIIRDFLTLLEMS